MTAPHDPVEPVAPSPTARKAAFGQTARAVAWSFLGIRRSKDHEQDVKQLNPVHVVIAGVLGALEVRPANRLNRAAGVEVILGDLDPAVDQLDLVIGLSYVTLLSAVGIMMIYESLRAEMRTRQGMPATLRRPGSHTWLHGLPFKLRFKRSKIYVSAIPVWAIGFIIGFVGAIMGIGGGFLLVPMLIYFLRVPTETVIGTSMVLTLITMASATVMHAATNHLVDAILALILMVGGVIGAQFGSRTGQKMRGERLRLLLGLLVFAVGLRFAYELVVSPDDLFSLRHVRPE